MRIIALLPLLAFAARLSSAAQPSTAARAREILAEDLGPSTIDVSGYPVEYQKTYEDILIPICSVPGMGGAARLLNSSIIELDEKAADAERAAHPALFSDPALAAVSKNGWRKAVDAIRTRPPCCGACPVLNRADAVRLWKFLAYDSVVRKTGAQAEAWLAHRRRLLEKLRVEHPERYRELYPDRPAAPHQEVAP